MTNKTNDNTTIATPSDTRLKAVTRTVCLRGLMPMMFDRYPGDNNTKLDWHQKVYLIPGSNRLCLPAMNIVSFFSSHNTNSAPKRLRDKRKFKDIANACLSFVMVTPLDPADGDCLPLTRLGEPIVLGVPEGDKDHRSGIYLHRTVARLDKGIPNPKERPVLPAPWELRFKLVILPNSEIKETEVRNLLAEGGLAIGLGTFRGVFGKFEIAEWS